MSGDKYFRVPSGVYACLRDLDGKFALSLNGPATIDLSKFTNIGSIEIDDEASVWFDVVDGVAVPRGTSPIESISVDPAKTSVMREDDSLVLISEIASSDGVSKKEHLHPLIKEAIKKVYNNVNNGAVDWDEQIRIIENATRGLKPLSSDELAAYKVNDASEKNNEDKRTLNPIVDMSGDVITKESSKFVTLSTIANGEKSPADVARQMRFDMMAKFAPDNLTVATHSVATMDVAAGLEDLEMGAERILVDAKRMINCRADLNQLVPFKYDWAWAAYLESCEKHWMPQEVNMQPDTIQWLVGNDLKHGDRLIVERALAFLSTTGSLTSNNLVLGIYRLVTNPEARQYLLRQAIEEATHGHTAMHCIQALGMDEATLFDRYRYLLPVIKSTAFISQYSRSLSDPTFHTGTFESDQRLLRDLIAFYVVRQGILNTTHFFNLIMMADCGVMVGLAQQFTNVLHDRIRHLEFGLNVINQIKDENPDLWTPEFSDEVNVMLQMATIIEIDYGKYTHDAGQSQFLHANFIKYVSNDCHMRLGFPEQFEGLQQPHKLLLTHFGFNHAKKDDEPMRESATALGWD